MDKIIMEINIVKTLTCTSWRDKLAEEINKDYFISLAEFIDNEKKSYAIYPSEDKVFNAFNSTPFEKIKVVVLGQDPYHGTGQAHGLAFSVQADIPFPPSLRNVFQEYATDLGYSIPSCGDLTKWAHEGVFLLNTVLTVRANEPHSHKDKGWEVFTDKVIQIISEKKEHVVFILWGKPAQSKVKLIDPSKHLILNAPHPSPLSSYRGFFGSQPFSKTNAYLREHGIKEIDWMLE